MEEFITACPRNCYSTCSFIVQTENNRIKRILPFEANKATPEGPCIKGLSYIERTHSKNRLYHPLIRTNNGNYSTIPADEALEIIDSRLSHLKNEYGPQSILWYRGSGNSGLTNEIGTEFWKSFGGATTTYGNLCWPAGLEAVRLTLGTVKHNVPWDLENARTIIIWGKNPAETNIQEMAFIIRAREKGCRVITIDTRRTPTADKSDVFYCPTKGTDAALALAMAKILIDKDLIDKDFINKYVYGFSEFERSLNISLGKAEEITGIPEASIDELALIIGTGGPVTFLPGYGLQRHLNGGQTIRSILALVIITGNLGKQGAGFNYANLQGYVFDKIKEPVSYYPDPLNDRPFRRSISMARLGSDMLQLSSPDLQGAWIERGNPLLQSPDSNNVRRAFAKLGFIVVVDQFMTDTARAADIILPAKDIFEQPDIVSSYWSPYVQFKPAVIRPEGEIMPESEIYFRLAGKMKLDIKNSHIPEPGNESIEQWLNHRISGYTTLTVESLKQGPVLAPGLQEIAYSDFRFETNSGKIELHSKSAAEMWGISELPEYEPLPETDSRYPVSFITPNAGNRIHSQFGNLEIIKEVTVPPAAEISISDAEKRQIADGKTIRIFNDFGELITKARISNRVPEGTIVLANGIWLSEGGGGNLLVAPSETDIGFGSAFHDTMVEFEKLPDNA